MITLVSGMEAAIATCGATRPPNVAVTARGREGLGVGGTRGSAARQVAARPALILVVFIFTAMSLAGDTVVTTRPVTRTTAAAVLGLLRT
jgi:hypothetical protein